MTADQRATAGRHSTLCRSKLRKLVLPRPRIIVTRKARGVLQMTDEGVEGAVLVMRRAEIAQAPMRLLRDAFFHRFGQPRFADARLSRDQHDPPVAGFGLFPATQQKLQLCVPADAGYSARAQRLNSAVHGVWAQRRPGVHRPGDASDLALPKVLKVE